MHLILFNRGFFKILFPFVLIFRYIDFLHEILMSSCFNFIICPIIVHRTVQFNIFCHFDFSPGAKIQKKFHALCLSISYIFVFHYVCMFLQTGDTYWDTGVFEYWIGLFFFFHFGYTMQFAWSYVTDLGPSSGSAKP